MLFCLLQERFIKKFITDKGGWYASENPLEIHVVVHIIHIYCILFSAESTITFTPEELTFMENHKEIRIGVDPKFVPFEFLNKQGEYSGIAADVLDIISSRTGLVFKNNPDLNWVETIEKAKEKSIDLLPIVGYSEERAQYLTFLKPYLHFQRNNNSTRIKYLDKWFFRSQRTTGGCPKG